MRGTLPNTDQPRIPHSEYRGHWRRRQEFFSSWLFLTVEQMAPRKLSMFNVADSDVLSGSVPCFFSCLSANTPTARPFSLALQALNLPGLHNVTRIYFFLSDIVSASVLPLVSLRTLALSGLALRVFLGRLLLVYHTSILELSRL